MGDIKRRMKSSAKTSGKQNVHVGEYMKNRKEKKKKKGKKYTKKEVSLGEECSLFVLHCATLLRKPVRTYSNAASNCG